MRLLNERTLNHIGDYIRSILILILDYTILRLIVALRGNDTTERFSRRYRRDGRVQRVVDAEQKGSHDWGGGGFLVFQPI